MRLQDGYRRYVITDDYADHNASAAQHGIGHPRCKLFEAQNPVQRYSRGGGQTELDKQALWNRSQP